MPPPIATTYRLLIPVSATRPTFCAKALHGKALNAGATSGESMSARRPCSTRFESTGVPTISPMARMSAVVSVMITRITIVIEMMAPIWNVGLPKCMIGGSEKIGPSPTFEKSSLPMKAAMTVPTTMPMRIDSREIAPWNSRLITRMISTVAPASPMLAIEP